MTTINKSTLLSWLESAPEKIELGDLYSWITKKTENSINIAALMKEDTII